jgi:hypothetical protein
VFWVVGCKGRSAVRDLVLLDLVDSKYSEMLRYKKGILVLCCAHTGTAYRAPHIDAARKRAKRLYLGDLSSDSWSARAYLEERVAKRPRT